jgi:hypothetical protein
VATRVMIVNFGPCTSVVISKKEADGKMTDIARLTIGTHVDVYVGKDERIVIEEHS